MNTQSLHTKLRLIRNLTDQSILVLKAAEEWHPNFKKDPALFDRLLRMELRLERKLKRYLKGLSKADLINWQQYYFEVNPIKIAANVKVTINNDTLDSQLNIIMNIVYDDLLDGMEIGVAAQQSLVDFGVPETLSSQIEGQARSYAADLAKQLNDTTRQRIKDSITTSMQLKEDIPAATARLEGIVNDPYRAQMIARTESVRSYSNGSRTYAIETGAKTKEWHTAGAQDEICLGNEGQGPIPIDESYDSGDDGPPGHPNCRCNESYNYNDGSEDSSD